MPRHPPLALRSLKYDEDARARYATLNDRSSPRGGDQEDATETALPPMELTLPENGIEEGPVLARAPKRANPPFDVQRGPADW
jgi:hypothetical protein